MKRLLFILLVFTVSISFSQTITHIPKGITADSVIRLAAHVRPSERQAEWQETEFSVFFHFGINTFAGLEWGKKEIKADIFNPVSLDARQWIHTARDAGARQVILVARHHDGFCNWPSAFTDYSVKNSPWKNGKGDVVKEVSEACRDHGMKFGIYLSPWDIHSDVYGTPEYNDYFVNLLSELLTNYGTVDEVWFDGACGEGPNGKRQVYDWNRYFALIRKLQPKAVIAIMGPDVRWVGTESGYGRETEWSVLPLSATDPGSIAARSQQAEEDATVLHRIDVMKDDLGSREKILGASSLVWYPSEVDVSIRPGWFYHETEDSLVKSPEKLCDIYFSSVGRNSGLLLNLPPDKRGLIHENDVKNLRGMRTLLDSAFHLNLAANARVSTADGDPQSDPANMLDKDASTFWKAKSGHSTALIMLELGSRKLFNCLSISEHFRNGQRVESFTLEVQDGNSWRTIATATTIGYKRLLRFKTVEASEIRIRITASRDNPEISEVGLYLIPECLIP